MQPYLRIFKVYDPTGRPGYLYRIALVLVVLKAFIACFVHPRAIRHLNPTASLLYSFSVLAALFLVSVGLAPRFSRHIRSTKSVTVSHCLRSHVRACLTISVFFVFLQIPPAAAQGD